MNNLKRIVILITSVIVLGLSLFSFGTIHADSASSYESNTLESYGIPDNVIQVLLDNSLDADGKSPSSKEKTPANFAISDVEQLTTVSLANRGSDSSTPNDTVASWVAGLKDNIGYTVAANVYGVNTTAKVTGDSGSLATKILDFDNKPTIPPFNALMQIIASDTNATTVDLTGVTSKVSDATLVENLLSLFQTNRLSSLETLVLAHDNLSSTSDYKLSTTIFSADTAQNITSLDLSYNGMDGSSSTTNQSNFPILSKLTNFNLIGNNVTTVNGWITNALTQVMSNRGFADLSSGDLNPEDYNTLNTLMLLLNAGKGDIKIGDKPINALIMASVEAGYATSYEANADLITKVLPQLTIETINHLIDYDRQIKDNADLIAKLKKRADELAGKDDGSSSSSNSSSSNGSSNADASKIDAEGNLDFGTVAETSSVTDIQSVDSPITVTATLNKGDILKASVNPWNSSEGSTFSGELLLPKVDGWSASKLSSTVTPIYTNTSDSVQKINQVLTGIALSIPTDQQSLIRSQSYTTTINWTLDTGAGEAPN